MPPTHVPTKLLVRLALGYCRSLLATLREASDSGSLQKLLEIDQPAHKDPTNVTRKIDDIAQRLAVQYFDRELGDAIERYGEEGRPLPADVSKRRKTIILIDPIDGTDLLARGLSNWCSALVFFYPRSPSGERILLSVVAHASGRIYYAEGAGAFVELPPKIRSFEKGASKPWRTIKHRPKVRLKLVGELISLNDSSICFYGQKADHLLLVKEPAFVAKMAEIVGTTEAQKNLKAPVPRFRIYNLGGNPMLAKIAEGTIDAVFRTKYCEPHDFVPGAFIAIKAGAVAIDLDGEPLSAEDFLIDPSKRRGYVVAASEQLAKQVLELLV